MSPAGISQVRVASRNSRKACTGYRRVRVDRVPGTERLAVPGDSPDQRPSDPPAPRAQPLLGASSFSVHEARANRPGPRCQKGCENDTCCSGRMTRGATLPRRWANSGSPNMPRRWRMQPAPTRLGKRLQGVEALKNTSFEASFGRLVPGTYSF